MAFDIVDFELKYLLLNFYHHFRKIDPVFVKNYVPAVNVRIKIDVFILNNSNDDSQTILRSLYNGGSG